MSFRSDLETWTANQVAVRALSDQAKAIRRLLRGDDVGVLGPVDSQGLPSEIRESRFPFPEVTETPSAPFGWVCWPSADNALYGWGDPYENPPGVPVNPPLGTVQTVYSDAAHIARSIDESSGVTHGVNENAGPRSWRHESTGLFITWGPGVGANGACSVYCAGNALIACAAKTIYAACVRWESGTPYLLWLDYVTSLRIIKQECVIVDDAVSQLVPGTQSEVLITGLSEIPYLSEFNDDGTELVISTSPYTAQRKGYVVTVPIAFGGSTPAILTFEAEDYVTRWVNRDDFDGSRKYFIKAQYISNVLTPVWLTIYVERYYNDIITDDYILDITENTIFQPSVNGQWHELSKAGSKLTWYQYKYDLRYLLSYLVERGTETVISGAHDDLLYDREYWRCPSPPSSGQCASSPLGVPLIGPVGEAYFGTSFCSPLNTYLAFAQYTKDISQRVTSYDVFPVEAMDFRRGDRYIKMHFGGREQATDPIVEELEVYAVDAQEKLLISDSGTYGRPDIPRENEITTESRLKDELDKTAILTFPAVQPFTDNLNNMHIQAMWLPDAKSVGCVWGDEDVNGLTYHSWLEGEDILTLLSIDGEPNSRIVIDTEDRFLGIATSPVP